MLSLAPRACTRMSVVLRAVRPAAKARTLVAVPAACWDCQWDGFPPAADRMWDSEMRRCRARSLARKAALSSGWFPSAGALVLAVVCAARWLWSGGREDCAGCQQQLRGIEMTVVGWWGGSLTR
jgi:hypothetical protein